MTQTTISGNAASGPAPPICGCGCGGQPKTRKARFFPGHNAHLPEYRIGMGGSGRAAGAAHLRNRRDEATPVGRVIIDRILERNMTLEELAREAQISFTGTLIPDVWTVKAPRDSTLRKLARVLGPLPNEVQQAVRMARRRGTSPGVETLREKVRRWTKQRLIAKLTALFAPAELPQEVKRGLETIPWTRQVGVQGFDLYMKAKGIRLRAWIPGDSGLHKGGVPAGQLMGSSPKRILGCTLGALERGQVYLYQCPICRGLRILASWKRQQTLAAASNHTSVCRQCWLDYSSSEAGRLWRRDLMLARQRAVPPPPLAISMKGGRRFEPEDLSNYLQCLIRVILRRPAQLEKLAEQMDLDLEYVKNGTGAMRRLLAEAKQARLQKIASCIAKLSPGPSSSI